MEAKKIRFVYFDIGGVLFNWHRIRHRLLELTKCDWDKFYQVFLYHDARACRGEITPAQLWQEYKKEFAIQDPVDNFDFLEFWVDGFIPYEASHQLLKKISQSHPFGYLTNIYSGVFAKQLEKKKIPRIKYSAAVQSSDLGVVKPGREIFDIAINRAGFPAKEILFIDDDQKNIRSAERFGFKTFLFDEENISQSVNRIERLLYV